MHTREPESRSRADSAQFACAGRERERGIERNARRGEKEKGKASSLCGGCIYRRFVSVYSKGKREIAVGWVVLNW